MLTPIKAVAMPVWVNGDLTGAIADYSKAIVIKPDCGRCLQEPGR